jgi:hypothetical protein
MWPRGEAAHVGRGHARRFISRLWLAGVSPGQHMAARMEPSNSLNLQKQHKVSRLDAGWIAMKRTCRTQLLRSFKF